MKRILVAILAFASVCLMSACNFEVAYAQPASEQTISIVAVDTPTAQETQVDEEVEEVVEISYNANLGHYKHLDENGNIIMLEETGRYITTNERCIAITCEEYLQILSSLFEQEYENIGE